MPPFHQYASVPVAADVATVHHDLVADIEAAVSAATASALTNLGPRTTGWGVVPSALPTTTSRLTGTGELGVAEVTWCGDEGSTGWPALTGRLVLTPEPGERSRLIFLSRRPPGAELDVEGLGHLHRHRITHTAVQRFLGELAHTWGGGTRTPTPTDRGARGFDRRPVYVHHLQDLDIDPGHTHRRLLDGLDELAARATSTAVARAHPTLEAGRFRTPADPGVQARPARPEEPATAWIRWSSDEEATGWPDIDLGLLVESVGHGTRLAVISTRPAAYDLSRNRVDKHQRHHLLQHVGGYLAAALADDLRVGPADDRSDSHPLIVTGGHGGPDPA
jgi:hypothetical protein